MATPGPGLVTAWIVLPVAAALAFSLYRLRDPERGWPGRWPIAVAALAVVPASVSVLVGTELVVALAAPVGVPDAAAIVLCFAAVFAGLSWGASHPWARERTGVLVGFIGLAILTAPFLDRLVVPDGVSASGLAGLVPGTLALTALAPTAADAWSKREGREGWAAPLALVVLLVPWTLLGGVFGLVEVTAGQAAGPAVYRWGIHADPSGEGPYTVSIPFPNASAADPSDETARILLEELRDRVHAAGSQANLTWSQDGSRVIVEAEGAVTLRSTYAFYGSVGAREAFTDYQTNRTLERGSAGPANLTVSWTVDFSGGRGHTCWARGAWQVALAPGEAAPFVEELEDVDADPRRPWGIVCA